MGLDMYLCKVNGDTIEEVGYWRKANAIHKYFVDTLQDGEDDCRQSFVDKETFEDLHEKCRSIVKSAEKIGLNMNDGRKDGDDVICMDYSWDENEKILEERKGTKKYADLIELCKNTLPSGSGFFFGSTEYDLWYIMQIGYTYHLINDIISKWDDRKESNYFYTCSW